MRAKISILAVALFGTTLLGGCAKEPKGQIVAVVNGEEITVDEMSAELKGVPVADNVDRRILRRQLLQDMIDRKVMAQRARAEGIDKTPDYFARRQRGEEEILAGLLGHVVAQTVPLPDQRDVESYMTAHPLQFAQRERLTLDQLAFAAPKDRKALDGLRDAHSLDAAAASLQAAGIAFVRGRGLIDSGLADPRMIAAIDQAPPGEPILLPRGDQLIVGVITARDAIAPNRHDAYIIAARAVRAATLLRESKAQVAQARSGASISYSLPGYDPAAPPGK